MTATLNEWENARRRLRARTLLAHYPDWETKEPAVAQVFAAAGFYHICARSPSLKCNNTQTAEFTVIETLF